MYYTEREVRELLEQAFAEGYDDGIDDTLDYIDENYELEDDGFDLMDEYDSYTESSKNVRNHMDRLKAKATTLDYFNHEPTEKEYSARNKNRDWVKYSDMRYTDDNGERKYVIRKPKNVQGYSKGVEKYELMRKNPVLRSRIKSGSKKSDDPRSYDLKEKVKENARRMEDKEKAKFRPFKDNRGNKY